MNILVLGAHPDDIEYGCGGSLLKFAEKNENIYYMILTKGEFGGNPEIRQKEQEKAQKFIGVVIRIRNSPTIESLFPTSIKSLMKYLLMRSMSIISMIFIKIIVHSQDARWLQHDI